MQKIHLYDKILSPVVTEKTTNISGQNIIIYYTYKYINKKIFKVNVIKVNIINKQPRSKITRGRRIRVPGYKKAIITLKKGQNIDLTTGI